MRIRQMSARSSADPATCTFRASCAAQIACTCSNCVSHSLSAPSSSMTSAAPTSVGQPAPAIASLAWMVRLSIISIAAGTTPPVTTSETTSPAARGVGKNATSVRTASGDGMIRTVISVVTPSVPSEPTNAPMTS